MADIKLKHPAATIDTQIDRVISGAVVTDNTDSVVTPDGKKPVSGEGVSKALNEGIEAGLAGLMPATPSGDPMHYAYVAAGAVYNATDAAITRTAPWGGESVSHLPGCWYLNGLGDIDNNEMRRIYTLGACNFSSPLLAYGNVDGSSDAPVMGSVRTNICRLGWFNGAVSVSGIAYNNRKIIVANMCIYPSRENGTTTITGDGDFYSCQALRVLMGRVKFTRLSRTGFQQCYSLQYLKIVGLANNLYLGDSKVLSKASLLYMINESAATSPIVITLHADVYAWASTDSDVQTALAAKPNVTIASA